MNLDWLYLKQWKQGSISCLDEIKLYVELGLFRSCYFPRSNKFHKKMQKNTKMCPRFICKFKDQFVFLDVDGKMDYYCFSS